MLIIYAGSLIALAIASYVLWEIGDSGCSFMNSLAGFIGFLLGIVSGFGAIISLVLCFSWFAAEQQANVINREYGTNYTQQEIFYASNVINTIQEVQRQRNEVTLNINQKKEKQ